jgi:hypothetical protein
MPKTKKNLQKLKIIKYFENKSIKNLSRKIKLKKTTLPYEEDIIIFI